MNIVSSFPAIIFFIIISYSSIVAQKFKGIALTPPMGWNSWNTFETNISEKLIKETVDAMKRLNLEKAGYQYIVLDDGWMAKSRDRQGNLIADSLKFPSGIKYLSDYIHANGFKFGLYGCAGSLTCAGYPGNRGHEYQDAMTYASWNVDYLKYDWCHTEKLNAEASYITMRDALYSAGRPILFSICEWGDNNPWLWGKDVGHSWRITGDITNCWDCEVDHDTWSSWGIMRVLHMRRSTRKVAGPGHWNDLDMLEVGNDLSHSENRAHFALWAMYASPLILGNDIRSADKATLEILLNEEVIAVNQDSLGIQGFKYYDKNQLEIWAKPLREEEWALAFLNKSDQPVNLNYDFRNSVVSDTIFNKKADFTRNEYDIRDLYKKKNIGTTARTLTGIINQHDVLVVRLKKKI